MKKTLILLTILPVLAYGYSGGYSGWEVGKFYRPKHDKRMESPFDHFELVKGKSVIGIYGTWWFGDFPRVALFLYDHTEGDTDVFVFGDTYWLEYGHSPYSWQSVFYEVRELNGSRAKSSYDEKTRLKFAKE